VCATDPGAISARVLRHAGVDVKVGVETGSMTPWLVHGLRSTGLDVACLDARVHSSLLNVVLYDKRVKSTLPAASSLLTGKNS
jgi:hypothetical protein